MADFTSFPLAFSLWISCVGGIFVLVLSSKSNIHNEFTGFVLFGAVLEDFFYLSNSLKKFLCLVSTSFWQATAFLTEGADPH